MIASTYNIPFILPLEMKLAAFLAALLAASTTNAGGYKRLESVQGPGERRSVRLSLKQ